MMSQYFNLEEGGGNSISESFQRGSPPAADIKRISSRREFKKSFHSIVIKLFRVLKKIITCIVQLYYPKGPIGYSVFLVWYMFSMFLDPLYLYIPVINDDKKCFKLDMPLAILAIFYRSTYDFLYVSNFILNMQKDHSHQNFKKKLPIFIVDLFIVLPLPQVFVILVAHQSIRATKIFFAMNFFLLHHALKVIRLYTLFQKAKTEGNLAGWAKLAFNLSYLHAGNLFGAIWYFFAVERQTICWRKACRNDTGCEHLSFYCNDISGNYTISNDFCSTKTQNVTAYDFGIFHDAVDSGVVEGKGFFQRFIPCFRWGLQNVSWFAQGLPYSADLPENIFVMSITISGVVLFFFLIGKVQMHVQSETVKSEESKHKLKEIEQWRPLRKLPKELQQQVKKYQSENWRETRGLDVEYLVNNLPEYLRNKIKRKLCLDLLKRAEEFGNWSDVLLEELCDLAKPVFYGERSYIVREGDPIDQMLFLLEGRLWTYSSRKITESSRTDDENETQTSYIDLYGKELLAWAQANESDLPVSSRTIQALTNVEAFVLIADDLKKGLRLISEKDRAARLIQLFWRSRRNTQTSTTHETSPSPSARLFRAFRFGAEIIRRD